MEKRERTQRQVTDGVDGEDEAGSGAHGRLPAVADMKRGHPARFEFRIHSEYFFFFLKQKSVLYFFWMLCPQKPSASTGMEGP